MLPMILPLPALVSVSSPWLPLSPRSVSDALEDAVVAVPEDATPDAALSGSTLLQFCCS